MRHASLSYYFSICTDPVHGSHQSSLQSLESSEAKQQPYQIQQQYPSAGRPLAAPTSTSSHHYQNPPQHHAMGIMDGVDHQHHVHNGGNGIYSQQGMVICLYLYFVVDGLFGLCQSGETSFIFNILNSVIWNF